ncbi:unnamed protein product [Lactuca virosa]|uniref:Uncharacterized protein n=1 Tax=Lactuca virosa TaxID=75947 RepID=A0AAU9MK58_9ASTR|nr:unnamed protein product [Lactuca virosa]
MKKSLIFNIFLVLLVTTGMKLLMAQEFCTTTHFLPICEKYACIHERMGSVEAMKTLPSLLLTLRIT